MTTVNNHQLHIQLHSQLNQLHSRPHAQLSRPHIQLHIQLQSTLNQLRSQLHQLPSQRQEGGQSSQLGSVFLKTNFHHFIDVVVIVL